MFISCKESDNIISHLNAINLTKMLWRVVNRDKEYNFILLDFVDKIEVLFLILFLNIL